MKCKHVGARGRSWAFWRDRDGHVTDASSGLVLACLWCGELMPFGPARDDGDHATQVAVEVRAAEIAAALMAGATLVEVTDFDEQCGYMQGDDENIHHGEHVGWLAREIADPDTDEPAIGVGGAE